MPRRSYRQIAEGDWHYTADDVSQDTVIAASVHQTFHQLRETNKLLREQNGVLQSILNQMMALGKDGLHEVIRHHRRVVKKVNAARRTPRTRRTE